MYYILFSYFLYFLINLIISIKKKWRLTLSICLGVDIGQICQKKCFIYLFIYFIVF
jgi:hypothetical protein